MNEFEWTIKMAFEQAAIAQGAHMSGVTIDPQKLHKGAKDGGATRPADGQGRYLSAINVDHASCELPPTAGIMSTIVTHSRVVTFDAGALGFDVSYDSAAGSVIISSVQEGSQASMQSVQVGDVLLEVDGAPMRGLSKARVLEMVHESGPFVMRIISRGYFDEENARWAEPEASECHSNDHRV